jgi:predicted GNAT family N-acyltransferase
MTSSQPPSHEIVLADSDELKAQCLKVRLAVFVDEQKFSAEVEVDEYDPTGTQFLLRLLPSLEPIGCIRMNFLENKGYYKLSRLCVRKDYRKYRFGSKLVEAGHAWATQDAKARGVTNPKSACHSQIPAKPFYARLGYTEEGEEFDEDGAPHQNMVHPLTLS